MKKILLVTSASLLSLAVSLPSQAETMTNNHQMIHNRAQVVGSRIKDAHIIEAIKLVDEEEIKAGQIAVQKATNPQIKAFAQQMINDHSTNLQELDRLSQKLNATPVMPPKSSELQQKGENALEKLQSLSGRQFDFAYMVAMVKGHEAALKAINEKLLPNASNPELKDFIKKTRTTVMNHLQKSKEIMKHLAMEARANRM